MQSSSLKTKVFGVLLSGHFSNALKRIITRQTKTEEVIILRWAIPGLFFLIFVFSNSMCNYPCWDLSYVLWHWKRLLNRLSHHHCPPKKSFCRPFIVKFSTWLYDHGKSWFRLCLWCSIFSILVFLGPSKSQICMKFWIVSP